MQCIVYPFIHYKWFDKKLETVFDFKKYFLFFNIGLLCYGTEEIIRFYQKIILNSKHLTVNEKLWNLCPSRVKLHFALFEFNIVNLIALWQSTEWNVKCRNSLILKRYFEVSALRLLLAVMSHLVLLLVKYCWNVIHVGLSPYRWFDSGHTYQF